MRSTRRTLPHASFGLACAIVITLLGFACARAAPLASGAVGGAWQTVNAPFLTDQRITALLPDGPHGLWLGAEERGLARWDGNGWQTYGASEDLPDSRVVALFLDSQHRLWVSTGSGLGYLPPDGRSFRRVGLDSIRSLPVLAFAETRDGGILLGETGGLDRLQPGGAMQAVPELDNLRVLALHTDRDGTTWAGTSAGLWSDRGDEWQREPAVGDGKVAAITEGDGGQLYVAGEAGLWQGQAGRWRRLPAPSSGEPAALAMHDGTVWLGASQGVVAGQEDAWKVYDAEFLPQAKVTAIAWSGDGLLWVGTTGGLAAHLPESNPPQIAIVSVNGAQPDSGIVRLGSDRIDRIDLKVHDLFTPDNGLLIFTRLDGVDAAPRLLTESERRDPGSVAIYAGQPLAPGPHVLHAWAQDDAFNRSAEAQVTIMVPRLVRGPAGLVIRQDLLLAGLAGIALVLTVGTTTAAAGRTRRRQAEQQAQATTAAVRAVADRSGELYSEQLPFRQAQVRDATGALQSQNVRLVGRRGMGKTVTLGQLARALGGADGHSVLFAPARVDLAAVREQELFHALMTAGTEALHPFGAGARPKLHWSDGAGGDYGEQAFSADLRLLLAWLEPQLGRRLIVVFLIDNAEMLDGYEPHQRDAFRRLTASAAGAASPARLALAAESVPAVLADLADLFHVVSVPPLDWAAATQLLRAGTRGLLEWEPEAERAAIQRAAGNPAKLVALGRAGACAALASNRLRITGSDIT